MCVCVFLCIAIKTFTENPVSVYAMYIEKTYRDNTRHLGFIGGPQFTLCFKQVLQFSP